MLFKKRKERKEKQCHRPCREDTYFNYVEQRNQSDDNMRREKVKICKAQREA